MTATAELAEYKQVTVMFADVVRSMAIAATVGTERLREIMSQLVERSALIVQRYGGTVNQFTGDGIMAVFGAPTALEDHALRACLAALGVQEEACRLDAEVHGRDGISLRLRIGLNSGQVITGDIGPAPIGYTAIGEQVGMAQRMESVAPPGGIVLSESTARLVEDSAALAEVEHVRIKGAASAVPTRRLLAAGAEHIRPHRWEPTLVGRAREMNTVALLLDQSLNGESRVARLIGPPGIGKSRTIHETARMAAAQDIPMYMTFSESHARDVPYRVANRLLRSAFGIRDAAPDAARALVRSHIADANPEDLRLLDDLLGIGDPQLALPAITPDARQRRLSALLKSAALQRNTPAVYVIEDAHWIDQPSESVLVDLIEAIRQTKSLVLITHRPEYQGTLALIPGAMVIDLTPLNIPQTVALTAELLGTHPSVAELTAGIADRAAGNPFFVSEIVRELAERGVLQGVRGRYLCRDDSADIAVPVTLQAAIAARVDRLGASAKQALYAAAVIGTRFRAELLNVVLDQSSRLDDAIAELLRGDLVDQVLFSPHAEYAFRHPLIQSVAYEAQLRTGRAELHRRVAIAIQQSNPDAVDQNAALVAEHFEAAGDLRAAFDWHMRAGAWSSNRDRAAARSSWQRARQVADRLPLESDRIRMQIASLTSLCGTLWLTGGSVADSGFDQLRELCTVNGDKASLAIGMAGIVMTLTGHNRHQESARLASELEALIESIGDPKLTCGLLLAVAYAKSEIGEMTDALRLAERVIDLADADDAIGYIMGSPLVGAIRMRGLYRLCLGIKGWRSDADTAIAMSAPLAPMSAVSAILYKYILSIPVGALPADSVALRETAEALHIAEQAADDLTLVQARLARGLVLVHHDGLQREGVDLLSQARDAALEHGFTMNALALVDPAIAKEKARNGDLDSAIELARSAIADMVDSGGVISLGVATTVLVEALLERGADGDFTEARTAVDRLACVPSEPCLALHELPALRLRARLARVQGDDTASRQLMRDYCAKALAADFGDVS
ncbi:MAG TPA: adenylate/guanylate cyclase domain-containing protein [Mycobacterium sp.]|nr:adenylate/guanylate cyclase domain-containing protein [Mycobacterium sp.]